MRQFFRSLFSLFAEEKSNRVISLVIAILVPVISGLWVLSSTLDKPDPSESESSKSEPGKSEPIDAGQVYSTSAIGAELYQGENRVPMATDIDRYAFHKATLKREPFYIALSKPDALFEAFDVEPELKIMIFRDPSFLTKTANFYEVSAAAKEQGASELFDGALAGADSPIGGNWISEAGFNCWDDDSGWNLNFYFTLDGRFTTHQNRDYAKYVSAIIYCDTNYMQKKAELPHGTWYLLLGVADYLDLIQIEFTD